MSIDYKTYRKDTFERLDKFDMVFRPWMKWENVKLSNLNPCIVCKIQAEYVDRRYLIMMSDGADKDLIEECKNCINNILWTNECLEKLAWYEDHDERLKNK